MFTTRLSWDIGSAYDMLVSLKIIHYPLAYGLRASWAAGVRSRLSLGQRETLELFSSVIRLPLHWLYTLPNPKNGAALLKQLESIPPVDRLPVLAFLPHSQSPIAEILMQTSANKKWSEKELKVLRQNHFIPNYIPSADFINMQRKVWTQKEKMGEDLVPTLRAYYESFFIEEEERIQPALELGLMHARERAGSLAVPALLEELSQGVRFSDFLDTPELVLVPSFWSAPFVFYDRVNPQTNLMLFGSRPDEFALIPGGAIPELLINGLKALADPTRLRILRNLSDGPQSPTQLARSLRLRTPTVTHHLFELRLAGLIQVNISSHGERLYATRIEGILDTQESLKKFVSGE